MYNFCSWILKISNFKIFYFQNNDTHHHKTLVVKTKIKRYFGKKMTGNHLFVPEFPRLKLEYFLFILLFKVYSVKYFSKKIWWFESKRKANTFKIYKIFCFVINQLFFSLWNKHSFIIIRFQINFLLRFLSR